MNDRKDMNLCVNCQYHVMAEKTFCGIMVERFHLCRNTYPDPVTGSPLNYMCAIKNAGRNCELFKRKG